MNKSIEDVKKLKWWQKVQNFINGVSVWTFEWVGWGWKERIYWMFFFFFYWLLLSIKESWIFWKVLMRMMSHVWKMMNILMSEWSSKPKSFILNTEELFSPTHEKLHACFFFPHDTSPRGNLSRLFSSSLLSKWNLWQTAKKRAESVQVSIRRKKKRKKEFCRNNHIVFNLTRADTITVRGFHCNT